MRERILNDMKEVGSITSFDAFTDLGCTRLSEYIRQIRIDHNVKDEWVSSLNRYGEKVQYKKYWLEEN